MTNEFPQLKNEVKPLVLAFDDDVILTGNSPRQAAIAAQEKYGKDSVIMSTRLKELTQN